MKNARTENAQLENDRKCTGWKMTEKAHMENDRMENAQPGKCKKNHTPEIVRKITIGKCTTCKMDNMKMTENAHPGK